MVWLGLLAIIVALLVLRQSLVLVLAVASQVAPGSASFATVRPLG
jgi:hypothetical protein